MIYLIWGLLNVSIFIYFIVISFRAIKLVYEKIGLFASIIFVIGLISIAGHPNKNDNKNAPNSGNFETWNFISEDSVKEGNTHIHDVELEKTFIHKYHLDIKYGKAKQDEINIPISANCYTSGFVSGTKWKPITLNVLKTIDNNKFEYFVNGVVEWKLLGVKLYTQEKSFNGFALIK